MTVAVAGRGGQVLAVFILFTFTSTITLILRVYCRAIVVKSFGLDDWLAVAAVLTFIAHASCAITGVYHGTGQHVWDIGSLSEIETGLKFWWLCEPFYVVSNMMIKASIAIMLLRITVRHAYRLIIYAVLVLTQVYSFAFFFVFIFQCSPSSYFWEQVTGKQGACLDTSIVVGAVYGYSVITCIGDWIYAVLPCFLIWDIDMGTRQKALVVVILSMGAIASAATIARLPYIHTLKDKDDFLYATVDVAIWSCSETGLGITAACCATLRPLLRTCIDVTRSSTSSGKSDAAAKSKDHSRPEEVDLEGNVLQPRFPQHHNSKGAGEPGTRAVRMAQIQTNRCDSFTIHENDSIADGWTAHDQEEVVAKDFWG